MESENGTGMELLPFICTMWCILSKCHSAQTDTWKGDIKALIECTVSTMNAITLVY